MNAAWLATAISLEALTEASVLARCSSESLAK